MGRPSGEALLEEMTASQFDTWKKLWALRPFGHRVDHTMTAQLTALIGNAHRDPNKTRPFEVTDFLPTTQKPSLKEQVVAVFSRFRGKKRG